MQSFLFDKICVLKVQIDIASIRFRKDSSSNNANIEEKTNRQWLNVTISSQENYDERKLLCTFVIWRMKATNPVELCCVKYDKSWF